MVLSKKTLDKVSWYLLGFVSVSVLSMILWDYKHGGVPSHHFLADEELPKVSNWWGAVSIPLATFFCLQRWKTRLVAAHPPQNLSFFLPFVAAFLYGAGISVAFATDNEHISGYLLQAIFFLGLFFPIYRADYYLGFVLGMVYTFGGVLPLVIGLVLAGVGFFMHRLIRPVFVYIWDKIVLMGRSTKD